MPEPGPLGRLVARRRDELRLTQNELNARTRAYGHEFGQNNVSRLERGVSQRVNDVDRVRALGKALELESSPAFILIAFGPPALALTPEMAIIEAMSGWPEDKKWHVARVIKALADPAAREHWKAGGLESLVGGR